MTNVHETDPFACPECGVPGTPQTRRNGVFIVVCEEPSGCDYEDTWEVVDAEGGE